VLCYRLISYWLPVAAGIGPGLRMLRGRPPSAPVVQHITELDLTVAG
jgi:hypothetical protein